jgi:hypothetical protein
MSCSSLGFRRADLPCCGSLRIPDRHTGLKGSRANLPVGPGAWEPDGADFFSPSLMEADLMRGIAAALPRGDPARKVLVAAAARHAEAALGHVASGHYAGEHRLASFATYLLSSPLPD